MKTENRYTEVTVINKEGDTIKGMLDQNTQIIYFNGYSLSFLEYAGCKIMKVGEDND